MCLAVLHLSASRSACLPRLCCVQEVCSLQALEGSLLSASQVDALLCDLGLVLGHIRSSASAPEAAAPPSLPHAVIAEKARRLIAFACDQGWGAVAAAVLPLASACCACAHDIVAAIHDCTAQVGGLAGWRTGTQRAMFRFSAGSKQLFDLRFVGCDACDVFALVQSSSYTCTCWLDLFWVVLMLVHMRCCRTAPVLYSPIS